MMVALGASGFKRVSAVLAVSNEAKQSRKPTLFLEGCVNDE